MIEYIFSFKTTFKIRQRRHIYRFLTHSGAHLLVIPLSDKIGRRWRGCDEGLIRIRFEQVEQIEPLASNCNCISVGCWRMYGRAVYKPGSQLKLQMSPFYSLFCLSQRLVILWTTTQIAGSNELKAKKNPSRTMWPNYHPFYNSSFLHFRLLISHSSPLLLEPYNQINLKKLV